MTLMAQYHEEEESYSVLPTDLHHHPKYEKMLARLPTLRGKNRRPVSTMQPFRWGKNRQPVTAELPFRRG